MRIYLLTEVRDDVLLRDLTLIVARDRVTTATLLAHLGEVDARKLYLPAGHASMFAYCVDELGFSEDAAYKRITAARAARRFPALFSAVEEGRLHLTALRLLAPHLTAENVDELLAASTHRRKSEIEELLARRFPPTGSATSGPIRATLKPVASRQLAPGRVVAAETSGQLDLERVEAPMPATGTAPAPAPDPDLERFALQMTIGRATRDKLFRVQALLSHSIPSGDLEAVLDLALDALMTQVEKRKFASTDRPRAQVPQRSTGPRDVPAHMRRAVWERDQGRCSFVGTGGRRCGARHFLEFDHVEPVARGGRATIDAMRLRCRAHNQLEAERSFGVEFMHGKREEARRAAGAAREVGPGRGP